MYKRIFFLVVLLIFVVPQVGIVSAETAWECPENLQGQTLRIFNWANYVAETTIPDFEDACGVTVEYFEFTSNDELLNIMQIGMSEYDIIVPTADMIPLLAEQGLIQPIDHNLIPNISNIGPIIETLPLDAGHQYSVPYQWGTVGIAYDTTVVDTPLTSWDDFFAYDGRVVWMDDSRLLLGIALMKLGYNFASIDEAEIQEAADYLLEVPNNDIFAISASTQADLLAQGEVDAVVTHSREVVRILEACGCEDFAYVFPEDGFVAYYDALVIPANAANPELAHAFMDYTLYPQVSADLSNALGSAAPNAPARALIDEAVLNNGISYPDEALLDAFLNDTIIVTQVGQAVDVYVEKWIALKAQLVN